MIRGLLIDGLFRNTGGRGGGGTKVVRISEWVGQWVWHCHSHLVKVYLASSPGPLGEGTDYACVGFTTWSL